MPNVTVTIAAGALSGVCSHAVGHTNYKVIPVPLAVTDTFLVSDIAATSFTLHVNAEDFDNSRVFTCILIVGSALTTVIILAGELSGVGTHDVGHTNYQVIPIPLAVTDTFLVSDIAATSFTLNVNAEDFENNRVFTCILVVGSAPVTVTILAGELSGVCTHSVGHTNYKVIPIALTVTDTFLVSDIAAASFTLNVNAEDFENSRVFTCILVVTGSTLYCTAADVEALCQIKYTQLEYADNTAFENALTTLFIPFAMKIIDNYCGHNFQSNTGTLTLDGNGRRVLMIPPPYLPILAAGTVLMGGVNITSNVTAYDTYIAYQGGVFTEDASSRRNISATLSYGYTAIPTDIQYATAQVAANILADMVRRKLMPESVARAMQAQADTVIFSGMSKSVIILTNELRDLLDSYRFSCMDVT